ncbi:hypothetical protein D3C87_1832490 [compost metagenome]
MPLMKRTTIADCRSETKTFISETTTKPTMPISANRRSPYCARILTSAMESETFGAI